MKSPTKQGMQTSTTGMPSLLKVTVLLALLALVGAWGLNTFVGLSVSASIALTGGIVLFLAAGFTTRVIQTRRRLARTMALEREVLRHAEVAFNQLRAEEAARAARQTSA